MGRRVVASYCSSFLKSEMLHIYRQVKALRGVDTFVVTKEVQNAERFPFDDIEVIPKRRTNLLVHGWLKFVERRPPIVYRGEYQTLDSLLRRHRADLMHIYFGHTGVHLLPFIEQWHKPCVVSFHGADVAHKPEIKDYPGKLRRLFKAVPLVFARSQSLAARLTQLGCPPEKLRINRTGIPLSEFPLVHREPPQGGKWKVVAGLPANPEERCRNAVCVLLQFLRRTIPARNFLLPAKARCSRSWRCLPVDSGLPGTCISSGSYRNRSCAGCMAVHICFCIPAKFPQTKTRKACRTRYWKRWQRVYRSLRRAMVEFLKRSITGGPVSSSPRRITWL